MLMGLHRNSSLQEKLRKEYELRAPRQGTDIGRSRRAMCVCGSFWGSMVV